MQTKVMVFGTFDGLHEGHKNLFKQARELAEDVYLIVSIARDVNVARIKGARPELSETKRLDLVRYSGLADKVVFGDIDNHVLHIVKESPDILALGYDQEEYVDNLENGLLAKGLIVEIVRLKAFKPEIYKNNLIKKKKII